MTYWEKFTWDWGGLGPPEGYAWWIPVIKRDIVRLASEHDPDVGVLGEVAGPFQAFDLLKHWGFE